MTVTLAAVVTKDAATSIPWTRLFIIAHILQDMYMQTATLHDIDKILRFYL